MLIERREFLKLTAASTTTVLVAGCGGGGGSSEPQSQGQNPPPPANPNPPTEPTPPTNPPTDPAPPVDPTPPADPEPDPPADPEPDPPADPEPDPPVKDPHVVALQNYLRDHATASQVLPPIATEIPAITWAGVLKTSDPVATTLPTGVIHPITSSLISRPLANQYTASLPGNPKVGGMPCLTFTRNYTCKGIARSVASTQVLRIKTDAPVLELTGVITDAAATVQTLIVDGKLIPPVVLTSARGAFGGWNGGAIRIDFGTRRERDIWIQTALQIAYIKIDQADSLVALSDADDPQITVIGDSYQQVTSNHFGNGSAIALSLGSRLGIRKVMTDAIGGTGYWNSGGNLGNLNDRLPAHAADGSAIYVVMAGLNDYGDVVAGSALTWPTRAEFENAVLGYLQGLRAAQPNALIVVTSPFSPIPSLSDSTYVAHAGTNTSSLGDFLYKADLFKKSIQQIAAPWVYVDVLMGTGWLNSSGATGDVTNLQWFTGGTPAPGTTSTNKPGNTNGGGGGGFGGIASIPLADGGQYQQAPDILATGGSGSGLLLKSTIDSSGAITGIQVVSPGSGYTDGAGLPTITVDPRFEILPAQLGTPTIIAGVNPNGQYPLLSFAPLGATADQLNNIYVMLGRDGVHPSPVGAEYIAGRLAQNVYQAVMAL